MPGHGQFIKILYTCFDFLKIELHPTHTHGRFSIVIMVKNSLHASSAHYITLCKLFFLN